jgi:hypothetical protein
MLPVWWSSRTVSNAGSGFQNEGVLGPWVTGEHLSDVSVSQSGSVPLKT